MSFYGSVYYQLVDTFYKVLTKNAGLKSTAFPEELTTNDQEFRAIGRKGILKLTTGNRWINFTQDENNNFILWHGNADADNASPILAYEHLAAEKPEDVEITEINPGDYFSAYTAKYDKAGHIVPSSVKKSYFKVPISETEEAIGELQEDVQSLYDTTEEHTQKITTAQSDINVLKKIYGEDIWGHTGKFFNNAFSEETFPGAFGSIDSIRTAIFGEGSKKTVSEAIIALNQKDKEIDDQIAVINELNRRQGDAIDGAVEKAKQATEKNTEQDKTLQTHGEKIQALEQGSATINQTLLSLGTKDSELQNSIATLKSQSETKDSTLENTISQNKSTLDAKDAELEGSIATLRSQVQTKNSELTDSISTLTNSVNSKESALKQKITALEQVDTEIKKDIASLQSQDTNINEQIQSLNETLSSKEESIISSFQEADSTITGQIDGLNKTIQELKTTSDLHTESISNNTNSLSTLNTSILDINAKIGTVSGGTNLATLIQELTSRVETLEQSASRQ